MVYAFLKDVANPKTHENCLIFQRYCTKSVFYFSRKKLLF